MRGLRAASPLRRSSEADDQIRRIDNLEPRLGGNPSAHPSRESGHNQMGKHNHHPKRASRVFHFH